MALQITQKKGAYYLKGQINVMSKLVLITYFNQLFRKENKIVINIEEINAIDKQGLQALFFMMDKAEKSNKIFSIVGYGCKDIYDQFNQKVA
ncbi:hypothetical protein DUT90_09150 [Polaribacter sp. WD7]|jgi:anti-anti-sigma regulatory factor|uniref:hypothetical protein n=1 Tax=Polaribacter sp. WD7 TaxID=2269061 RepID=UPI000DF2ED68|nr:hypothetical protein [Polaribacter sp. WD7]RCS27254.1 hypothetical protein DUT90_09150 [Polaribacter sp. WD7]